MYFAIMVNKKRQYILVKFNVMAERDTFVKYTNFHAITEKDVRKYVSSKVFHLCNGSQRVAFDNNGICMGKVNSLYKCVTKQKAERPEDTPIPCAPVAKRKNIINATTAHQYTTKL